MFIPFIHIRKSNRKEPAPSADNNADSGGTFQKKIGIGIKLICGVAIASNIFILMLLYAVWFWDREVYTRGNRLLEIQEELNSDLRQSVAGLQERIVTLPALLETDPGKRIFQWLKDNKTILGEKTLVDHAGYKPYYTRTQRRDLAKGKFIVQKTGNRIVVSKGLFNASGKFTDKVQQINLQSQNPVADEVSIRSNINRIVSQGRSGEAMRLTLQSIKADIADELIAAEKSRTQVLEKLELIENTRIILGDARQQRKTAILFIGILTIAANIFIIFFLTRHIILKPLNIVIKSLKGIAKGEGDLSRTLPVTSTDELGELGFAFNNFMEKLKAIISQIQGQMGHLKHSNKELAVVSDDLGQQASRMQAKAKDAVLSTQFTVKKIERMAASAKNAHEEVQEVADMSADVSSQIVRIGESTREVSEAVGNIAASVEEISSSLADVSDNTARGTRVTLSATQKADESTAIIKELSRSAKEINDIVVLIKGIADQTHLLSLNAAIEAAGAGEAGKGFSVVAKEVKELSQSTAAATTTIRSKIEAMQTSTRTAVKSILSIIDIIKETHGIMSTIADLVSAQALAVNDISKNISGTSTFADAVSTALGQAAGQEKKLSEKLSRVSADARKIARDADDASGQTRNTRENVEQADAASLATFENTQRIEDQIRSLHRMYDKLNQIVVQFRIE